jgi:hypothetical protein
MIVSLLGTVELQLPNPCHSPKLRPTSFAAVTLLPMILARDRVISVLQSFSPSRRIRTQWKCWVSLPKKVEVLEMS